MGPIYQWIISHTVMKALERKCPKCHKKQVVPLDKKKAPVVCKACGAMIAPK